jgi:hypothetical protein
MSILPVLAACLMMDAAIVYTRCLVVLSASAVAWMPASFLRYRMSAFLSFGFSLYVDAIAITINMFGF